MKRLSSVDNLIRKEVSNIILKTLDIGRNILTTVTRVETSSNIIESKVYISVIPEKEFDRVLRILNRNIYHIQQELNKQLKIRPVPRIVFLKEDKTKSADKVERMLDSLKNKE
ncbi:MAG: 30S ribosome-binding factor RbfA [Candidatus Pacebacteria bacterium]|jgi:ribosome-binding factor A|nr:30S ribosome-binding factor RbfA [Candidatus Paceibacterota bacterium]MDD3072687.1 30S ribosome-binding factor RbfA [Candidatus Paceibacterota bacterium]MDD3729332.1 30S ribosome-binding factor RbfA [Candidatus Paceibacterota bacterium]MDD4201507.1 30S ribosome-binding factor RbfA [Candidatus Paceibacterota bacterium]MDD4467263.1 30S ribosome-binding factor RbfA [Candidatus Paceibacterota bacterium]